MEETMLKDAHKNEIRYKLFNYDLLIVWKPEYELGIPIIDEQHRGIVTTINSLYYGMQHNYGKEILAPIADMVYNYTRIHFQTEESFLKKIDFPNAEKHHDLHRALSSKLAEVERDSLLNSDPYEFMNFLRSWWINHICKEDLIYRDYFLSSLEE